MRITVQFSSGMEANVPGIGECAVLSPSLPKENCPAIRYTVYPCFSFLSHQNAICKPMAEIDDATKVFLMDPIQASS